MHLRSTERQTVSIEGVHFTFDRDETIWTESCHKYGRHEARGDGGTDRIRMCGAMAGR